MKKSSGIGNRREPAAGGQMGIAGGSVPVDRSPPMELVPTTAPSDSRFPIPDSRLSVRRAAIGDLAAIVALRMALLREHAHNAIYGRLRTDADARATKLFAAQLQSPNEVIFLAELAGECVGVLRCIQSTGSPLLEPAQYAYVSSVYVMPKARERGVLKRLLAAAERWCADRGLDEMRLHNAVDNPLANAAWDALGFEVVEHLRVRSLRKR